VEDFFFLTVGFAICAAPFVGIGFLITLLRRPEDKEARERLDALEQQLAWVRGEGTKLGQRIVQLEQRNQALEALLASQEKALAEAKAAGTLVRAATPEGVTPAHAAAQQERASLDVDEAPPSQTARAEEEAQRAEVVETSAATLEAARTESAETTSAEAARPEGSASVVAAEGASAEGATDGAVAHVAASEQAAIAAASSDTPPVPPPPISPPPTSPSPPPTPAEASTDEGWERWIGVRGAAALGASVLVIAALYFFQYSIEHGWIGPFARVLIGLTAGTACVLGSEPLRRRYEGTTVAVTLANWLAGAGIAILYASSWAASGLYHLVPTLVSGVAMVAITGACAGLAVFRDSLAIAVLGLFGGFLTPIALSTGEDRPISLFTYLFVLDAALLFLAQRKRWPALAGLALGFTALYQLAWIFGRMEEATTWIGLVITLVFAALFAGVTMLLPAERDEEGREVATNRIVRVAAVLLPFALAIAFATQRGPMSGFGATLTLVCVLSLGALLVAVRDRLGWLAPAAASAAMGLYLVFLVRHHDEGFVPWQAAVLAIAPALLFHLGAELAERGVRLGPLDLSEAQGLSVSSLVAAGGATGLVAIFALEHEAHYLVWALVIATLSLLVLRVVAQTRWAFVGLMAALVHGAIWALWGLAWADRTEPIRLAAVALLGVLHLGLYQALAVWAHRVDDRESAEGRGGAGALLDARGLLEGAAAVGAAVLLSSLTVTEALRAIHLPLHIAITFVLGLFVLMPAMRAASRHAPHHGLLALVATVLVAFVQTSVEHAGVSTREADGVRWIRFGASAVGVVLFTVLPTISRRLAETRWAWRAAAIAPMLWFEALHHGWLWAFGTRFVGALPVLLALLTLSLVALARTRNEGEPGVRTSALVWLSGATMLFVTVAIPLQLDREWITIGWALEATALLALYRRLDHPGLKWVAMLLFVSVGSRLLLNPYVLGYYERGPWRIVNWLSYTYLVPAACLVVGGVLLRDLENVRLREWERAFTPASVERPFTAILYAMALVVGFAWLNLTIVDWYATGPTLSIPTDRLPARDLTISIAWALYGLVVLALGMWRESTPMRLTSLFLVLLTAGKVFLYDLSNLRDLYRVAALVGLAFSLITISLAYQRFVFRSSKRKESA
jgi:uncharacterized membrane protein